MMKSLMLGVSLLSFAASAGAQTMPNQIVIEEDLGAASAYDVGTLQAGQGALDPTLWNGTAVSVALAVIEAAPNMSVSAATEDLVARTLLSGGSPPQGGADSEAYFSARLGKLVAMGRADDVEQIMGAQANQASSAAGRQIKADQALTLGKLEEACQIADSIEEARGEPYWAKLRAFCHVTRKEIPAAELTADLLRRSGHEAPEFYKALRQTTGITVGGDVVAGADPLLGAMVRFIKGDMPVSKADAQAQLDALIADAPGLKRDAFGQKLAALTLTEKADEDGIVGGYFDVDATIQSNTPASWGKLYGVVKTGTDASISARAAGALLERAQAKGIFKPMARLIEQDLHIIPTQLKAQSGVESFARIAVMQGDLGTLQALYSSVRDDDPRKARIALASDALGNGFMLGSLGQDMTAGLSEVGQGRRRAMRDTFIAVALGARLSDEAAVILTQSNSSLLGRSAKPTQILALKAAAARGAKAETALRAAAILGDGGPKSLRDDALGEVLSALVAVGLQDMAGRLAAEDFLG